LKEIVMQTFRQNRSILLLAALSLPSWATVAIAQQPTVVDMAALKNAGTTTDQLPGAWLTYGRSQSETRYSSLKQIDTSNVKRLGLAWSYVVGAGGGSQEGTPLVWHNTLYGITTWSVVYAVDGRTGKEIWRWDPEINQSAIRAMTGNS
jgi:glucose dehydrogenase